MKKKDKDVLFLCQFFYPEYISSATLPFDTASHLSKAGYKVGVLCGYPKEYWNGSDVPKKEQVNGIDIHRINYVQLDRKSIIGRVVNYFSFIVSMFFHMKEAKAYKTIFVYSNPPLLPIIAIMCKKLYRTKLVFISYDVYPELAIKAEMISENGMTSRIFKALNKKLVKKADKIVAVSTDMEDFFRKTRGVSEERTCVIPNWYEDCSVKEYNETNVIDFVPKDAFVISYLGNLGTCQDEDIILKTAKFLHNEKIYFLIAGHGNKIETVKEIIKNEQMSNIAVLPFLQGDDYETVLKRSNAFWVTLIPELAGLCAPSKTYAYFMSGKPVIATMDETMEIVRDIIGSNAGIVTKNGEYEKTAQEILKLRNDKELLTQMGENARKIFESKYEKQMCLRQYEELLKEIILDEK